MARLLAFLTATVFLALPAASQEVTRAIHPVAGDVYLFQNNFHMSLIVATDEGTVRVDPINEEAGLWLNENLDQVTDQPVTHLIYSHSHGDHASGGSAHPDAEVIAHEDAPDNIHGTTPTMRVGDQHSMTVGGKTIELVNLGSGHDNHMLVTVVRPENVAFIVDVAAPRRFMFRDFGGANLDDWRGQIETAMAIDFDVFAPGHGSVGNKQDLADVLTYMQVLKAQVMEGLQAGKSSSDLQSELTLADYADWGQYDAWRELNILGMARFLVESGQVN